MTQAPSPERVREVTEAVLDRPEFRPDPSLQWLSRIWNWFFEQLPEWSLANPTAARILIVALSVVLVLLLAHLGYTVIREFASLRGPREADDEATSSLAPLAEVARSGTEAVRLARQALDDGNLHRAIWIAHRVLLAALDKAGALDFRKWKTNGDYVRECREREHARDVLVSVTRAYDAVVYAHHDFDRAQAATLLDRVEALAGQVGL